MKISLCRCGPTLLFSCTLSFAIPTLASSIRYTVTEIGPWAPGHHISVPVAINDVGQVIIRSQYSSTNFTFLLYQHGQLHELPGIHDNAYVNAINNAGTIVGSQDRRGFVYQNGTLRYFDSPGQAGYLFTPWNINDAGTISGNVSYGSDTSRAFVYENGVMRDLGLPDNAGGQLINNRGDVAGYVPNEDTGGQAFLYSNGQFDYLGNFGRGSWASGMNDHATVVGASLNEAYILNAFIYENGVLRNIASASPWTHSQAVAVNNANQVIGLMNAEQNWLAGDPFLWEDGVTYNVLDLLDPTFKWRSDMRVTDINNAGQIVGYGCWGDECRSFLLTPVPEPAPGWMLASGLALLAARATRRGAIPTLSRRKP